MSTPPLRGKRGAERRLGERLADEFVARHRVTTDEAVDFDVAEVDREVEDAERADRGHRADEAEEGPRGRGGRSRRRWARNRRRPAEHCADGHGRDRGPDRLPGPRRPAAVARRDRFVRRPAQATRPPRRGGRPARPARRPDHRSAWRQDAISRPRSPLPTAASGWSGSRATPRSATASRRSSGRGWATPMPSPCSSRGPRWPTSAASSSRTRRPPGSRRWPPGGSGRARILVASVQALLQRTIDPDDLPGGAARRSRPAPGSAWTPLLRELLDLGYQPIIEVAGRGEFARRGGIVDVFPPSSRCRSGSSSSATRSIRCGASTRPTSGPSARSTRSMLLPASEFLVPAAASRRSASASAGGGATAGAAGRGSGPVRRRRGWRRTPARRSALGARVRDARATRALDAGDAAEVWAAYLAPRPASIISTRHVARPRRARRHRRGRRVPVAPGRRAPSRPRRRGRPAQGLAVDLSAARATGRPGSRVANPRADLGVRGRRGRWPAAGSARATCSAGASRSLPPGRDRPPDRCGRELGRGRPRIVLASDQAPAWPSSSARPVARSAVVDRLGAAPPPGAIALIERSLNGGFVGGPDGVAFVTDRELFGTVRVRRPKAMRRVVPRDILERLAPGRPRRPHRPRHRPLRADAPARRRRARSATTSSWASPAATGSTSRSSRSAGQPLLRRRATRSSSKLGGTEWLRTKQRVKQGRRRPGRGAARAVRGPRGRPRPRLRPGHALAGRDGGVVPVRGDRRPAARRRRGQGRHGGGPADGPAGRRRRRLRQDRGRAAGRLQGGPGRQAGRRARADDRPRRAALRDLQRSASPRSR